MESTWRRTLSAIFIFVSLSDVFGQNKVQGGLIPFPSSSVNEVNNECSNGNSRSPSSQLMNTLFTIATANGLVPDLLPAFRTTSTFQGQRNPNLLLEQLKQQPPIVDVPIVTPSCSQGPVIAPVFQKPEIPSKNPPQPIQVSGTYLPPGLSPTMIPSLTTSHDINQMPVLPPPPSVVPLEAYPFSQPRIGYSRPLLLQPQAISDDSYPKNTPVFPEINPSIQIDYDRIPAAESPIETFNYDTENSINQFQSTIVRDDCGQLPISLQINMPAQNMPAPRVTVITANPPAPAPAPQTDNLPLYPMYTPPMPPIIIEGSRSKLRNWLPIIMIALLSDGCQGRSGNGSCGCSCPCNCGSSNIPIPYPIPIPTNNPVVSSSRSRSPFNRWRCNGLTVNNKLN